MENHALHGYGLYYTAPQKLWVNLYAPSIAAWAAEGVKLTMDTSFPEGDSAKITLAIDMTAVVAAQDQDTGAAGNAYGMWQENGRIQLRHVDRNSTLKNGDPIATSSNATVSSAYVPGGILIGQVDGDPVLDNQGDTQTVNIIPFSDFDNLEVVSVIVAYDPATDVPLTPEPAATPVAGQ
jgi:cell shape-determining protein MreC